MAPFEIPQWIESDALIVRPFTPADADQAYYALFSDPAIMEFLPMRTHQSVAETHVYLNASIANWESKGPVRTLGMFSKVDGRLCGSIELHINLPRVELGFAVSRRPGYQRRRASLAILRKLIDWLMAQPQIYRVYACCDPQGQAAVTMERLGFTLEARLTNWEPRPNRNASVADALMFAMTKAPV